MHIINMFHIYMLHLYWFNFDRYIEYTEDESLIREQDYFNVLTYIADNPVGNPLVWDYVRDNWEYMVDR